MDAIEHSNDFKPVDFEGDEVESSHLQLETTPSNSQSKVVVESSCSFEAQSLVEVGFDNLLMDSTSSKAQSVVGEILHHEDAQVVDNPASNLEQCSYDSQAAFVEDVQVVNNYTYDPQVGHVASLPSAPFTYNGVTYYSYETYEQDFASNLEQCSYDSQAAFVEDVQVVNNYTSNSGQSIYDPQVGHVASSPSAPFTYNGVTYYSYETYEQDFRRQFLQEMQMDSGVVQTNDGIGEPQFSDSMVFVTGGSPAFINPHNGLPWRKGANLCRPYMDEGCCHFGTACIFHHPWPPIEELP